MTGIDITNKSTNISKSITDADYSISGNHLTIRENLSSLNLQIDSKVDFLSPTSSGVYI